MEDKNSSSTLKTPLYKWVSKEKWKMEDIFRKYSEIVIRQERYFPQFAPKSPNSNPMSKSIYGELWRSTRDSWRKMSS